nr:hypothetical protein GCM10020185_08610 [Pseudomonas brassicacearum subsp. brassicacearum]
MVKQRNMPIFFFAPCSQCSKKGSGENNTDGKLGSFTQEEVVDMQDLNQRVATAKVSTELNAQFDAFYKLR